MVPTMANISRIINCINKMLGQHEFSANLSSVVMKY